MMETENNIRGIRLRAMEPEDLELLYSLENDREVWDVSATNVPYSRYVLRKYIAQAVNDIYLDGQVRMMVEAPDGQVAGVIDLVNFDPKNQRAELGIVLLKKFRGKGYGQAAVKMMQEYARSVLHLHQIYACVCVDNETTLKTFKSLGFREATKMTDWLYRSDGYRDAVLLQYFL